MTLADFIKLQEFYIEEMQELTRRFPDDRYYAGCLKAAQRALESARQITN